MRNPLRFLFVVLALCDPSVALADDLSPGRAFTLRVGVGADALVGPDRLLATAMVGGTLPVGEWFGVDLVGALGLDPEAGVGRASTSLAAGLRAEIPLQAWRPYAALRLAHVHDAPLEAWGAHFGETLAGDPSHGLAHLTALGGALGLVAFVPGTDERLSVQVEASGLGRVHGQRSVQAHDAGHVAQHRVPDAWLGATIALGWQFL